jgi:hypothetical protein
LRSGSDGELGEGLGVRDDARGAQVSAVAALSEGAEPLVSIGGTNSGTDCRERDALAISGVQINGDFEFVRFYADQLDPRDAGDAFEGPGHGALEEIVARRERTVACQHQRHRWLLVVAAIRRDVNALDEVRQVCSNPVESLTDLKLARVQICPRSKV